jgi:hypothetical protein
LLLFLKIQNNLSLNDIKAQIAINHYAFLVVMAVGAMDMAVRYFFLCGLADLQDLHLKLQRLACKGMVAI